MLNDPTCRKCGLQKNAAEFAPDKRRKCGHGSYCRVCQRGLVNASYRKNLEANRVKRAASTRAYYARNRSKVKASSNNYARVKGWAQRLVISTRETAKRWGYAHDLDAMFLLELLDRQGGKCYWLGVPLTPSDVVRDPQRPSVDRLDNSKGYTRDNVVLSCQFANMGRSVTGLARMREFVSALGLSASNISRLEEAQSERYMLGPL